MATDVVGGVLCVCRLLTEEIKRRENTYRETIQRWSGDQQALTNWQRKTEGLLLAIESMQNPKP